MRKMIAIMIVIACYSQVVWAVADNIQPEAASGYQQKILVESSSAAASTAHPLASNAARIILEKGGSAVDASIAAQLVLNVVEPQSSGIGGGGFMLFYSAADHSMRAYDGREVAPMRARATMFLNEDGTPLPFLDAVQSGQAVGVPAMVDMMWKAHQRHGVLPWSELFTPALILAEDGYPMSPRLYHNALHSPFLSGLESAAMFMDDKGVPHPVGKTLKNHALAESFRAIAKGGHDAFYKGDIAESIIDVVTSEPTAPSRMTMQDLADYRTKTRELVCQPYRSYRVCSMPPPSSGGVTLLQALGILQQFDVSELQAGSVEAIHLITEATRIAFADRNRYMADPDFVPVPVEEMLAPDYLATRAGEIQQDKAAKSYGSGEFVGSTSFVSADIAPEKPSTTHMSIVDAHGNAVAMTSSIEYAFGSGLTAAGFLLNNQLTDFSFNPEKDGQPTANRVEAGKRPRSSMSPTFVFDAEDGDLMMVIGSPGGARIIPYVLQTIVNVLDWDMDIQRAINQPRHVHVGKQLDLERGTAIVALAEPLKAMGHKVSVRELPSGLHGLALKNESLTWTAGADPRRDGTAVAVQ